LTRAAPKADASTSGALRQAAKPKPARSMAAEEPDVVPALGQPARQGQLRVQVASAVEGDEQVSHLGGPVMSPGLAARAPIVKVRDDFTVLTATLASR
jgi:hypothetical protein